MKMEIVRQFSKSKWKNWQKDIFKLDCLWQGMNLYLLPKYSGFCLMWSRIMLSFFFFNSSKARSVFRQSVNQTVCSDNVIICLMLSVYHSPQSDHMKWLPLYLVYCSWHNYWKIHSRVFQSRPFSQLIGHNTVHSMLKCA
jgi:hypothetical protein